MSKSYVVTTSSIYFGSYKKKLIGVFINRKKDRPVNNLTNQGEKWS